MPMHFSIANTEITTQDLIVWEHFLGYRKWRNGEVENYGQ